MKLLDFDNRFIRELPADALSGPGTRQVQAAAYSLVAPTPVAAPRLFAYSSEVARLLDLDDSDIQSSEFLNAFSGNDLLPGMQAYAANYGGHQFGHWAGQLGDGRAIALGEVVTDTRQRWELQLKGAGPTPYSRHADGRASSKGDGDGSIGTGGNCRGAHAAWANAQNSATEAGIVLGDG